MKHDIVMVLVLGLMIVICAGLVTAASRAVGAIRNKPACHGADVHLLCQQIDGVAGSELRCRRLPPCKEK